MKNIIALAIALGFISTHSHALTFAESVASEHQHFGNAVFGISRGGFSLGADYEYMYDRTYTIGGYFRMMPKDDAVAAPGFTAVGAFFRPHIYKRTWNFFLSPGFGMIIVDSAKDETVIGPSIAWGLSYQFNNRIAFGFENMKLYSWTGSSFKGQLTDDLFASVQYAF